MKIYQVLATVVVEDAIDDDQIKDFCTLIDDEIRDKFYISNQIINFTLKEKIDYADLEKESSDVEFDNWIKKSQEIIEIVQIEMKNL